MLSGVQILFHSLLKLSIPALDGCFSTCREGTIYHMTSSLGVK